MDTSALNCQKMKNTTLDLDAIRNISISEDEMKHFLSYLLFRESNCSLYLKNFLWENYKQETDSLFSIRIELSLPKKDTLNTSDNRKEIVLLWPNDDLFERDVVFFLQYEKYDSYRVHDDLQDLFHSIRQRFSSLLQTARVFYNQEWLPSIVFENIDSYFHKYFPQLIESLVPYQKLLSELKLDEEYLETIISPDNAMLSLFSSENNPIFRSAINLVEKLLQEEGVSYKEQMPISKLMSLLEDSPFGWDQIQIECIISYLIMNHKLFVMYNNLHLTPHQYAQQINNIAIRESLFVSI